MASWRVRNRHEVRGVVSTDLYGESCAGTERAHYHILPLPMSSIGPLLEPPEPPSPPNMPRSSPPASPPPSPNRPGSIVPLSSDMGRLGFPAGLAPPLPKEVGSVNPLPSKFAPTSNAPVEPPA